MLQFIFVILSVVHCESQLLTLGLTAGVENGNAVISQPYASVVPVSGGGMYSPMGYGMSPAMGISAVPSGMYSQPAMMPYYGYPSMSYGASPIMSYGSMPYGNPGFGAYGSGYPAGYGGYGGGSPPSRPGPVRQFLRGATEGMLMSTLGVIGRK